ncbi:MAG: hypothetical protein IIY77_02765, partial [Lachnospiraceae bacterium]|nr:hypothetical protein [Lachnospiraceae bacterium]
AVQTKFLTDETKEALELVEEILLRTEYSDTDRIRELLEEKKSQAQQLLVAGGHATAARRVLSGTGTANYLDEKITGIEAFRHLEAVLDHFDETKEALPEAFVRFGKEIFTRRELLISFTGSEEAYKAFAEAAGKLLEALPEGKGSEDACIAREAELFPVREGIKTVSQVQYNAMGGNARLKGYPYTGAYNVLRAVLGSDYLWNRLRVLGGAYGCFSTFKRNGDMVFASYRDPAVAETLEVYRELPEYLRNYEADEREMTKNIIGAINGMDAPLSPQQTGTRSLYFYLYGLPESVYQTEREQVLSCTPEDLRALAEPIEAVLKDNMICVLGNADVIEENREIFDRVMTLSKEEA